MSYENELDLVRSVLDKRHIGSYLVDFNDEVLEAFNKEWLSFYSGVLNSGIKIKDLIPNIESGVVYKMSTPYSFCYIFLLLPGKAGKNILLIGPYLPESVTGNRMLEIGEMLGIAPKDQKLFEKYFESVPILQDSSSVFVMLDALGDVMWGKNNFSMLDVSTERLFPVSPFQDKDRTLDATLINMKLMEQRYAFENEMMSAVSRGQSQKVAQLMSSFSDMSFEKRVSDPIRNAKNYSIIMNTLLRKAAESGGVHPVYLDSVSSSYAVKIEQLGSISAANDLMVDMFQSYCRLVRRHSMGDYSPTVQKAIVFIESDLSADLTLSSIAEAQNVSSGYLSAIFRRETGKTITEYIREKRVNHAIYLLETTHLQVQTIATHCGIVDLQYFSKIFKKHTGKTPKEYRESIKKH